MTTLELTPQVFAILSALIEEQTGLHYALDDRQILADKMTPRVLEAGFESMLDYYYYLRYDPDGAREVASLAEVLTVGETYFFREFAPLEVLVDVFITRWLAEGRRVRIWSAACATGEEPLTLAMMLDRRGLLKRVSVVATDLNARALEFAQAGRFGPRSLRRGPPAPSLLETYARRVADGIEIDRRLIEAIAWRRVNLVSDAEVSALGTFDAILCRNVLIYFSDATTRSVVKRLARSLVPDGIVLVGVAESLLRYGSALVGEEVRGSFVYRRGPR